MEQLLYLYPWEQTPAHAFKIVWFTYEETEVVLPQTLRRFLKATGVTTPINIIDEVMQQNKI